MSSITMSTPVDNLSQSSSAKDQSTTYSFTDLIPRQPAHVKYLDGLRAMAAIYVVLHHALLQLVKPSGIIYSISSKLFSKGHFAVDAFIVISGFCLIMPVARQNILAVAPLPFIKKRIKRILPTYYLAMGFSLLLIYTLIGTPSGTNWDASIPVTRWDMITHLTLIQDLFNDTNTKINHAFWSISVEFRIYFLFPLLVFLFRKLNPFTVAVSAIVLSVVAWAALSNVSWLNTGLNGVNFHYLGLFAVGMLAAHIAYNSKVSLVKIKESAGVLILMAILGAVGFVLDSPKLGFWVAADIAVGGATACLLIALSAEKRVVLRKLFSWKPLAFAGTFAYSIYLIHAPLLEVFSRYVITPLQLPSSTALLSLLVVATPAILLCSYGFYLIAERPFIKKKVSKN